MSVPGFEPLRTERLVLCDVQDEYLHALLREEWLRRGQGATDGAAQS